MEPKVKKPRKEDALVIPAGTEQETGFTRAQTEKENGPVQITTLPKTDTRKTRRKR